MLRRGLTRCCHGLRSLVPQLKRRALNHRLMCPQTTEVLLPLPMPSPRMMQMWLVSLATAAASPTHPATAPEPPVSLLWTEADVPCARPCPTDIGASILSRVGLAWDCPSGWQASPSLYKPWWRIFLGGRPRPPTGAGGQGTLSALIGARPAILAPHAQHRATPRGARRAPSSTRPCPRT